MKERNKSFGKNPSPRLQCGLPAPRQGVNSVNSGDSGGAALCLWAARPFELVRTGYQGTFTSLKEFQRCMEMS